MTRNLFVCFVLACLIAVALAFESKPVFAQNSCGITPITPIPPVGCKAMVPVCSCDINGHNCRWLFQCVK